MLIDGANGLTVERLRQVVKYDAETGEFSWLVSLSYRKPLGSECGEIKPSGYRLIGIDGTRYRAHRLAWLYMTGEWPDRQVDHKNGVRSDNSWENLRLATQVQNSANMRCRDSNRIGVKGVSLYTGKTATKYRAHIFYEGRTNYLGSYDTVEEAQTVYLEAAKALFGEFARAA